VNPLYFGTGERRIFGIYEPAAGAGTRSRATVLCHPLGSEYIYAHRSMRQLALKLCRAGHHTLRFDFFGTGDSAGEMTDADLRGWETDVESAIEGLEDIVGDAHVTLIGLRLGANIAATVAARRSKDIDALVLWDPIVSGAEYLRELGVAIQTEPDAPDARSAERAASLEVQGFPLTPSMLRELQSIELNTVISAPPVRSLMLVTQRTPSHGSLGASRTAAGGAASLTLEYMTAECPWAESATISGAVPVPVIQRIVEWLG
jgi:pimeloyl-ACP methyl ester carboxylesterase